MIPLVKVCLPSPESLMPRLQEVLYSGQIAEGQYVYDFEEKFRNKFNLKHAIAMSSGTAALHAALTLAGVSTGDEVISTPMTAEPTNTCILYCGAKVVWADIDPTSGNMDPTSVRNAITKKTKAIVVVHYAGYPARLNELRAIADEFNVVLIEDCAHALGAQYDGKSIGTIGDFGIFSFQAIKHMTTVDGGALTFTNPEYISEAKKFRWFGMLKGVSRTEVDIQTIGYKYNMSNVTAVIGLSQLEQIDAVIHHHQRNGIFFDQQFHANQNIQFARSETIAIPSYWLYTLLTDQSHVIEARLVNAGITASKLHRPNHLHSIFARAKKPLPGLDTFYRRLLHIPCGSWLTEQDKRRIADIILQQS
jgi:perosamine synthetase